MSDIPYQAGVVQTFHIYSHPSRILQYIQTDDNKYNFYIYIYYFFLVLPDIQSLGGYLENNFRKLLHRDTHHDVGVFN